MLKKQIDSIKFDRDTGARIEIDLKDTFNLLHKVIVHDTCGKQHIDRDQFTTFNHRKHLCEYCDEYFRDSVRAIGIEEKSD
ncbi:MAG: hypothetical protein ACI9VM_000110 [Candidatus Azotimanducaceae bacterium]|jgi:hypothetical protein